MKDVCRFACPFSSISEVNFIVIPVVKLLVIQPTIPERNRDVILAAMKVGNHVNNSWLKTLVLMLVVGIIIAIVNGVVAIITTPFGIVSPLISGVLTAFITPILPIALTLYYYSMKARTQSPMPPPPPAQTF